MQHYYLHPKKHHSPNLRLFLILIIIFSIGIIIFLTTKASLFSPQTSTPIPTPTPTSKPSPFTFKFNSIPQSNYIATLIDGTKKKGKTPFSAKILGGEIKIKLTHAGYNDLNQIIKLDKNIKTTYYLDKSGQLVHHLFNIENVPSPKGAAFTPNGKEIWVTRLLNKKKGLSIFDATTGKKITDVNLASGGGVEVVFSKDGKYAYVSQMETASVYEISTKTKKVTRIFPTGSAWTKILAISPDGKTIFASNWSGNDVSEIDITSGKLRRRLPTVKTPRGLYITPDNQWLYVAGFDKGEIQKINLKTESSKIIYNSGGAMRHIVSDENKKILYVSDMAKDAIFTIDLKTDVVNKFANTDRNPNTIGLTPDKKVLFVSCRGKNATADNYYIPGPEWGSVLLFDTNSGNMLDAIVGGNQPTALDISLDGEKLIFSDFLDGILKIFSIPNYETLKNGRGGRSAIYRQELQK